MCAVFTSLEVIDLLTSAFWYAMLFCWRLISYTELVKNKKNRMAIHNVVRKHDGEH